MESVSALHHRCKLTEHEQTLFTFYPAFAVRNIG